jgi:hypothetical protein
MRTVNKPVPGHAAAQVQGDLLHVRPLLLGDHKIRYENFAKKRSLIKSSSNSEKFRRKLLTKSDRKQNIAKFYIHII